MIQYIKTRIKIITFITISIYISNNKQVFSQKQEFIDSLLHLVENLKNTQTSPCISDTGKAHAYIELGEVIFAKETDSAIYLWEESIKILETLKNSNEIGHYTDVAYIYMARALNNIGYISKLQGKIQKAIENYEKSLHIKTEISKNHPNNIENKEAIATSLNNIAFIYENQGNISKSLKTLKRSLLIYNELKNKIGISMSYNNIGRIFDNQGDKIRALEYYNKSLKIQIEIDNKEGIATSYNNIGYIYNKQGDLNTALKYYQKSLSIKTEIKDKRGTSYTLNNIGTIYINKKLFQKARESFSKSLIISTNLKDKKGIAYTLNNIGTTYKINGDLTKALNYYKKSLAIRKEIGEKEGIANSLSFIGQIFLLKDELNEATKYAKKSYKISHEIGYPEDIKNAAGLLSRIYIKKRNFEKGLKYFQEEVKMKDSTQNEKNFKTTQRQEARFEYEIQAKTDSISHHKAMEIKDIDIARIKQEKKAQLTQRNLLIIAFSMLLALAIFIYKNYSQKKNANDLLSKQKDKINKINNELNEQNGEIERLYDIAVKRKNIVETQNEKIEDSIIYAKRIQNAILPTRKTLEKLLKNHFVIYKPKDIVSGDFYWTTETPEWTIIIVADCTGHGVPGAFMSMLGISFLNGIFQRNNFNNTSEILNNLRTLIIKALKQTGEFGSQKDGMDMSILALNKNNNTALWSGANNHLWLVKNIDKKNIREIKGDKMPVAIHLRMDSFTNHKIELDKGDRLFLFSDGFPDQFGGPKGKKFKHKAFKNLIINTSNLAINKQAIEIESAFEQWKNYDGTEYEQIDDITILGIEI